MKHWLQNLLPQHILSRCMGKLADARLGFLTRFAIKHFISHYQVNLSEAEISDYHAFETFNAFFTRALKSDARIFSDEKNVLLSPADGCVSECGFLEKDQMLQAKGAYFSVNGLCGGESVGHYFENGAFLTAYLSPRDYHRFHIPIAGRLEKMIYVPGKLFSVNTVSVKEVPGLFAKNERVICLFETAIGKVAVIAVGAMIVGSIVTQWHGVVAPQDNRAAQEWKYSDAVSFDCGDELGHFRLGSTVIVLCQQDKVQWVDGLQAERDLRVGEAIGFYLS